ncbi:MAG: RsmB/NOP family class I SAM-dependent RNA methyltransferase [Candidatus Omnitrophota bacterium]
MKAIVHKLPSSFLDKIKKIYPSSYPKICESFLHKKEETFRINYLKTDLFRLREDLDREGINHRELHWPKGSFILKSESKRLRKSRVYTKGDVYSQNVSSMMPPLVLSPKSGERILDLCAAPGAKTTQIASLAGRGVELTAIESMQVRYQKLLATLSIQGADFVKTRLCDGIAAGKDFPGYFDKVLLDAPCSCESLFYLREPKSFGWWNEKKVKEMSRRQKALISSAIRALKEGGELVYSTCAFSPEENEEVVDWALNKFANISLIPIEIPITNKIRGLTEWEGGRFSPGLSLTRRILPNEFMEGFFIAKFKKSAAALPR